MTREEAIQRLRYIRMDYLGYPPFLEPIDMAIEALQNEETLKTQLANCHKEILRLLDFNDITESSNDVVESQDDVIEVVRCKECTRNNDGNLCDIAFYINDDGDGFCNCGERREP